MTYSNPEPLLTITDLETLKVISDPLRLQIVRAVSGCNQEGRLCSVKQIADALDLPQARLYYHIKQLESQGLLVVEDTHIVSGIVEKLYRVQAYRIIVASDLFNSEAGKETIFPLLSEMLNKVYKDLRALLEKPDERTRKENISISRHSMRLPADKVQEYSQRLEQLLDEIEAEVAAAPKESAQAFTFFSVLYPETTKTKENSLDHD